MKLNKEQREIILKKVEQLYRERRETKIETFLSTKEGKKLTKQWLDEKYPNLQEVMDFIKLYPYIQFKYGTMNSYYDKNIDIKKIISMYYPFEFGPSYLNYEKKEKVKDALIFESIDGKDALDLIENLIKLID